MKKIIFAVIFSIIVPASFSKNSDEKDKGNGVRSTTASENFDLANIGFKENILSIYKLAGADAISSEEKTLFGYDRSESTSPKLLNYNGLLLSGDFDNLKNKVIFLRRKKY